MKTHLSSPSRSVGIDAVRVLGIAAVIFGHVYTGPVTHQFIYAWHVPLFFVLTGYLWKRGRPLTRELLTRGRTLALPYAGWFVVISVLVTAVAMLSGRETSFDVLFGPAWGGANARGPFGTFWFVSVLFFTAVLFRMLERLPRPVVWLIAVVGLAGATS